MTAIVPIVLLTLLLPSLAFPISPTSSAEQPTAPLLDLSALTAQQPPQATICASATGLVRRQCCLELAESCLLINSSCSTHGALFPPIPCEKGTTCVLQYLGNPVTGVQNSGTCRRDAPIEACSVPYCARRGAATPCELPEDGVATCSAWAARQDGGTAPQCSQLCPDACETLSSITTDRQRQLCNICSSWTTSCNSGFRIFGTIDDSTASLEKDGVA